MFLIKQGSRIISKTKSDPNVPNDKMMKLIQCLTIYKTVWILLTHSDLDQDEILFLTEFFSFRLKTKNNVIVSNEIVASKYLDEEVTLL